MISPIPSLASQDEQLGKEEQDQRLEIKEQRKKVTMCDPSGLVHFRACITSYSISQSVLKNCLAVLAVWATFALTLLVCKYRDSITYG